MDCRNCIKSKQIKDGKVKGRDLKDSAVTGSKIAPDAVDGSKIADGAVGGSDMSSSISLGTSSAAGGFSVKDTSGSQTVSLDGATGTVTNSLTGDGVVKAWAKIRPDGTVEACYRCNTDPAETQQLANGFYEVDFTPLSTDIRSRPRTATADARTVALATGIVSLLDQNGVVIGTADNSSVLVSTLQGTTLVSTLAFTIVIY